ncbi:16S rRNA (uracil(1498)-N(3))-methyltransferase [Oscillospiraceae bacterium NSJ-54]|uniref:Ribosomal RNA small subunit methyltransferase E n=2 Tax=Zongyangia hominis TaxID=2763677 RepID=A0A926EEE4_9FIRM|nr:16S rRNA (uracil(1498)-N(3))-methyltransferase [Zongyangia hominis]
MPRFFTDQINDEFALITGEDARHIGRSLRMAVGEELILCDGAGSDYRCRIASIDRESVRCDVLSRAPSAGEPACFVTLYQALPKSDKLDLIVQKAVELGVGRIVPILTRRCVSRPDEKGMRAKQARAQRIALEAAKQSGRGRVPEVAPLLSFPDAVQEASLDPLALFFYEGGGTPLRELLFPGAGRVSLFVGSEGGFDPEEVRLAEEMGLRTATLGPRILRCETAPLCALSVIMYATGNL